MKILENIKREAKLLLRETSNWEDKEYETITSQGNIQDKLNFVARYKGFKGWSDYLQKTSLNLSFEIKDSLYDFSIEDVLNDNVPEFFKIENKNITPPQQINHNEIEFLNEKTTNIASHGMFIYSDRQQDIDSIVKQVNTHFTIHNGDYNFDTSLYHSKIKIFITNNPILKRDSIDPLNPIILTNDSLLPEIFGHSTAYWLVPILKDFHANSNGIKLSTFKAFFNLNYLKTLLPFYPQLRQHFKNIEWHCIDEEPNKLICINHLNSCIEGLNFAQTLINFSNCFSEKPTLDFSKNLEQSCYVRTFNTIDEQHSYAGKISTMALLSQLYPVTRIEIYSKKFSTTNYCLYPLVVLSGDIEENIHFPKNRYFGQNLIIYANNHLNFNTHSLTNIISSFEKFILNSNKISKANIFLKKILIGHKKYDFNKTHFYRDFYLDNKKSKELK